MVSLSPIVRAVAWCRRNERLRDILTGIAIVVAVSLLLNRGMFGFEMAKVWIVNYGNF